MLSRWTFPREQKKNMLFFSRFAETLFSDMNELMTNVHFRVKKNTVTLKLVLLLLIRNSVRENKKPCVKKFIFVCVKIYSQYVKIKEKVYVKNPNCAWKFWKKCTWKEASIREKNEKMAKKTFHAHFLFSRTKKKHWSFCADVFHQWECNF